MPWSSTSLRQKCFEMDGNDADTLYYWVPILSYQCLKTMKTHED